VTKLTNTNEQQEAAPSELTEHHPLRALVYPFEVIVSPFKAFKEIAQNPDFKGFVLIAGLIIATSIGVQYVYASKILLSVSERQPISPTLYTSLDTYVYVTTFGNYTFKSSQPHSFNYTLIDKTPLTEYSVFLVNTTETLTPANPRVTTANDTFIQTTADLNQSTRKVGNLTLTAEFYRDERPNFSLLMNKTEEWNFGNFSINWFIRSPYTYLANITNTIDLASKTTLSLLETNADRAELGNTSSINNWRFSILNDWSDHDNATIYGGNHTLLTYSGTWLDVVFDVNDPKIDLTTVGLTYTVLLSTKFFGDYLPASAIEAAFAFFLSWVIYAGALFLTARMFGEKENPLRPFLILVGYVFSVILIRTAVSAVLISTLPQINFQTDTWPPANAETTLANAKIDATWGPTLAFQVGTYFNLLVEIWFAMLGAIAVHASSKISWAKAAIFSVVAYFIHFILRLFLGL